MWESYEQFQNQLSAVYWNLYDWFTLSVLHLPPTPDDKIAPGEDHCYLIHRPGSINQVRKRLLQPNECTVGYNLPGISPGPIVTIPTEIPNDLVLLKVSHFSVNYADVCIRWGLYDSANKYVGWPICPGFDIAGTVLKAGPESGFVPGDKVFGATMFGGYSSKVLAPARQLRKLPGDLPPERGAALPAVAHTAVHALHLAGFSPTTPPRTLNKGVLVHSAAGGVGSMLCTLARKFGASPVVGVVGRPEKVKTLAGLCDKVALKGDLWKGSKDPIANEIDAMKFQAIFDANGQETLKNSYDHLTQGGRVIIYGFHSNVPSGNAAQFLNPWQWVKILLKTVQAMPKFDPMMLTLQSKGALGFNLSFFAEEFGMLKYYFDLIVDYVNAGVIGTGLPVTVMKDAREAHIVLSSAASVGKLVVAI